MIAPCPPSPLWLQAYQDIPVLLSFAVPSAWNVLPPTPPLLPSEKVLYILKTRLKNTLAVQLTLGSLPMPVLSV